jgi:hypothetical protein
MIGVRGILSHEITGRKKEEAIRMPQRIVWHLSSALHWALNHANKLLSCQRLALGSTKILFLRSQFSIFRSHSERRVVLCLYSHPTCERNMRHPWRRLKRHSKSAVLSASADVRSVEVVFSSIVQQERCSEGEHATAVRHASYFCAFLTRGPDLSSQSSNQMQSAFTSQHRPNPE